MLRVPINGGIVEVRLTFRAVRAASEILGLPGLPCQENGIDPRRLDHGLVVVSEALRGTWDPPAGQERLPALEDALDASGLETVTSGVIMELVEQLERSRGPKAPTALRPAGEAPSPSPSPISG